MSIASELTLLGQDKTAIANAITAKGGSVNQGDGFHTFAADIATIPSGGDPNLYINQFFKDTLTSITEDMMSGVTEVRDSMFERNTALISITIPDGVLSVGNYAFRWCSGITSMYLPDSIGRSSFYALGESMLSRCTSLSSVRLPTVYGLRLPYGCFSCESIAKANQLESITIPANFGSIGSVAFYNCANLKSVTVLRTTPPTLDNINSFQGTHADLRIYVPYSADHSILNAYQTASNWSNYSTIIQELPQ